MIYYCPEYITFTLLPTKLFNTPALMHLCIIKKRSMSTFPATCDYTEQCVKMELCRANYYSNKQLERKTLDGSSHLSKTFRRPMKPSARGSEMSKSRGNGEPSICSKSFQLIPGGSQYSCLHNHSLINSMLQEGRTANLIMACKQMSASAKPCGGELVTRPERILHTQVILGFCL